MAEETAEKILQPKFAIEEVGPCKLKINVEIAPAKIRERIEGKYRELNDNLALPGFRKGHAPQKLLERKFGKGILEDLKFQLLNDSFEEIREERKLEPLGDPEIDVAKLELKEDAPFAYELTIEVRPKIDLKNYTGLKVKQPKVAVQDKEIDAYVTAFRESKAEFVSTEEPAKEGDQIIADFELVHQDEVIEKTENTPLFLNDKITFYGMVLTDFYKKLVKQKAGSVVEYPITFPDKFRNAKCAGQPGTIRTTLKSVKNKKLPDLTDAWVKTLDMDSVQELKDEVRKRITREKEAQTRHAMAETLTHQIVDTNDFTLPEGLVRTSTNEVLQRRRLDLTIQGVPADKIELELDKYKSESRDQMVKSLKSHFLLEEIGRKERIFVTEEEVENHITVLANQYGKWPHEMKQVLEQQDLLPQIRRQLREDKVREFLLSKATVEADE